MKKLNRVGERYITNEGYEIEIIKYNSARDCAIKFTVNNHIVDNLHFISIKDGKIKNPYYKSVCGIGYFGVGIHKSRCKKYDVWVTMLSRCYSGRYNSYNNCSVCGYWHNYQIFGNWFDNNYNTKTMSKWALDKDILVKGNKIYSPETCCFVPNQINNLIKVNRNKEFPLGVLKNNNRFSAFIVRNQKTKNLGRYSTPEEAFQVYKDAKEQYIKEVADKWKDKIDSKVYQAMYNYKVEITD